jgi:hypothetical protein
MIAKLLEADSRRSHRDLIHVRDEMLLDNLHQYLMNHHRAVGESKQLLRAFVPEPKLVKWSESVVGASSSSFSLVSSSSLDVGELMQARSISPSFLQRCS